VANIQYFAIAFSLLFLILIMELVRRQKLKEQYSLLWITASGVMVIFALWKDLLERVSSLLGVHYAPSTLFLVSLLFALLIILHFSVIVTKLSNQNIKLAQELALLTAKVQKLENEESHYNHNIIKMRSSN
jgi:hypothetical protein